MDEQTSKFLGKVYVLAIVLVAGLVVFLFAQVGLNSRQLDLQNQNQISVSGEGKVYAKPDVAMVTLGMKTDGQNIQDITTTNVNIVNKIIKDLKDLGIEEKDIQTTNYSVSPKYNWTQRTGSVPDGYTIQQDVQVKIRNFDKIGNVLQAAGNNGANVVSSLQFTIDDPEELRAQARAEAIAKAKANAQKLADQAGISLGKLINVYEGYNPYPVAYSSLDKAVGMGGASSVPMPIIQPGQQEINVTINLTYQVR